MPLVSITRLRVRSWRYMLPFIIQAGLSVRQAKSAEGSLSVSVLRQPKRTFWTRTVWTSEEAMKTYMLAGAHGRVMRKLMEWCDEAAVVHWTQESPQPPDWPESHHRMQSAGRASKVNHPSEDHRAYRIAPLSYPLRGAVTLK